MGILPKLDTPVIAKDSLSSANSISLKIMYKKVTKEVILSVPKEEGILDQGPRKCKIYMLPKARK